MTRSQVDASLQRWREVDETLTRPSKISANRADREMLFDECVFTARCALDASRLDCRLLKLGHEQAHLAAFRRREFDCGREHVRYDHFVQAAMTGDRRQFIGSGSPMSLWDLTPKRGRSSYCAR